MSTLPDQPNNELEWSSADARAVDTIRVLAIDAVEKAGTATPAPR